MRTGLLIALILPLCSPAPLEIASLDKNVDAEADHVHDGTHNHREGNVYIQIEGDIVFSGSAESHDLSIGHQVDVDVHGHDGNSKEPIDCKLSGWSDWSVCTVSCGGGTRTRLSDILVKESNGGKPCKTTEEEQCLMDKCPEPIDCKLSGWSDWSVCTVSCGGGTRTRLSNILVKESNGGKPCKTTEEEPCLMDKCPEPVDCSLTEWSEWSDCSVTCGGGHQSRTRRVTVVANHEGKPCDILEMDRHCNTRICQGPHMLPGDVLKKGDSLTSPEGKSILKMTQDGNLVLYNTKDDSVRWSAETQDCPGSTFIFQMNGNLVIKDASDEPCWESKTFGTNPIELRLRETKFFLIDRNQTIIWDSSYKKGDKCFSAEGCPLVQYNQIMTTLELKKEFLISFQFQPTEYITGWQNVLHMLTTGENAERIVTLGVKDDGQLHPWFTAERSFFTEKKYAIGQWHSVEFSQRLEGTQYFYRVKINGVQVVEVVNNEPNIFSDVKVYASGPGTKPLKGSLRNLVITMEKTKGDAAEEESKTGCGFDDNLVRTPKTTNPGANAHMLVVMKPWYEWKDGKIPYYFKGSVIVGDKNLIQDVMNEIEQHTCFEFILHDTEPLGHHLEIVVESNSCVSGFSAYVTPKSETKILLHSYFQFTDADYCPNNRGGILHEMMHVFGIMHTHNRNDRDHFITVHPDNIYDLYKSQYEICTDCRTYREIPYECDSIMHYGFETCVKKSYGAKTMTAKDPSTCHLSERGPAFTSMTPTKNDWKLLTIVAGQVCGAKKSGYVSVGCWRDYGPRAIETLEGKDSRLQGKFEERINAVEICFEVAKSKGYPMFAVQAGGMCLGSSTAMLTYKKYGAARYCPADGKGGNWISEVYKIEGSCEVHVGSNKNNNFKSATVSEGCECPSVVNKYNWLGGYGHPDTFGVTQKGQSLEVQRTDGPVGWELDLAFMCVPRGSCEVYVGKSDSNIKSATVEEGCECPEEVDIDNWINKTPPKFAVTQNEQSLEVQRVDFNAGWKMDLVFKCKHTGNYIQALKQLRITVQKLKNVVNGVDEEHVEDLGKLSIDEEDSLNKLNIAAEHLKSYCKSENEDCTSKQILVSEKEIEKINESVNQNINGNEKIGKEFLIDLKEKLEELDGAAKEAQKSFKQQTGCEIDKNVNYFHNNLHSDAKKTDSAYQCSKLCGMTKGCKYWTFRKSEEDCWLKDSNTDKRYDSDAISGAKDCPKGNSIIETIRILIPTIKELKKSINGLGRDEKIVNESDDETELLNIMDELTRNLKNHCTNKNGFCKSEELVTLIKKLASTFENIKETGKISSGFLVNFEEYAENLVLAAEKAHNFIKEGPTSFTECKSGTGCSCGSESCTEGQICTDAKCLNECEVKKEELLTEDCFCPDKEEGKLCEGGIDICTDLGCMDTSSHHVLIFLLLG